MTRDDVISMAREAGLLIPSFRIDGGLSLGCCSITQFEQFAELVAKHEREECAKVCEQHAKDSWDHEGGALSCADKIRARGEQ